MATAKKILVIDDSATVRQEVRATLSPAGYDILEAADGLEGAEAIDHTSDLSLVICDVNMPRMNGLEMLTAVKAGGRHPRLPVLMLTTEGRASLIKQAQAAGASAWMVKPFKADHLLAAVRKLAGA